MALESIKQSQIEKQMPQKKKFYKFMTMGFICEIIIEFLLPYPFNYKKIETTYMINNQNVVIS